MKERKEIDPTAKVMDLLILLSEGNPGALRVLAQLFERDGGFIDVLHLDDMNIRGSQVWVAFKDFAKEDWATFTKAIRERNQDMIRAVNEEGLAGNHPWQAIVGGASEGKRPLLAVAS